VAPAFIQYLGTGRRKSAIARVFLRPGEGKLVVNGRGVADYFPSEMARMMVKQPLQAVEMLDRFDVLINAHGGGVVGQAGAARLGIARALCVFNPELRGKLKSSGFLSRDPRQHERKKYGQKGARKRFQFSKR
jgi:small subunit ribosomal protein S9